MKTTIAYLVFSLVTTSESGFPIQRWTAIQYPSLERCRAEATAINATMKKPEAERIRALQGVSIPIEPRCTGDKPQFWITEPAQ